MRKTLLLFLASVALVAHAQSDPTQPTLVTIRLENAAPKQVFDELANQAALAFSTLPAKMWDKNPGAPVTFIAENQPFWLAMKDACAKTGVSLKYATDTAAPQIILTRDNQDWTNYPAVGSGPFLVNLIGLHRASTVDMRKPNDVQRSFFAKFSVFCEPRVRLLRGSLNAKVDAATDDKGNSLTPKSTEEIPLNFVTTWAYNLEGKLEYPAANAGTRIPLLRASARFIVQTKSETIEIPDPLAAKNVTKSVAGRKVTIKDVQRAPEEYQATVTFSRDQIPADQWPGTVFPGNTLRLVDADGKMIIARGFGLGGKSDDSTYVFKFEKEPPRGSRIGKPLKLIWEIPTETREIPLAFEFKDVPVP
jgi:hypothetical protein